MRPGRARTGSDDRFKRRPARPLLFHCVFQLGGHIEFGEPRLDDRNGFREYVTDQNCGSPSSSPVLPGL